MYLRLLALALGSASVASAQQTAPPTAEVAPAPTPAITLEELAPGTGASPTDGQVVLVDYRGTLADGTEFDAGNRVLLPVDRLIPGFTQGLKAMRVGGRYRLTIPAALGYGDRVAGPIPPGSTLTFEVTLHDAGPPSRARAMQGLRDVEVTAIAQGSGRTPAPGELVLLSYTGRLADGTQFDQGRDVVFMLDQLVPGFAQGLQRMRVGGRYRLFVPADLAYGASGAGPVPPGADLSFEVDLIAAASLSEIGAMMRSAAAR